MLCRIVKEDAAKQLWKEILLTPPAGALLEAASFEAGKGTESVPSISTVCFVSFRSASYSCNHSMQELYVMLALICSCLFGDCYKFSHDR